MKLKNRLILLVILLFSVSISAQYYGKVVISKVYFDTHVVEKTTFTNHHAGEFIELFNSSTEDVDISNWKIEDNYSTFTFPENTIIKSGGYKVITYTATKALFTQLFPEAIGHEDDIITQHRIVLNNNVERVYLKDNEGELVANASYYPYGWENSPMPSLKEELERRKSGVNTTFVHAFKWLDNRESNNVSGAIPSAYKKGIQLNHINAFYENGNNTAFSTASISPFSLPYQIPLLELEEVEENETPTTPSIQDAFSNENYIVEINYQEAYKTNELSSVHSDEKIQNITYYDGLGRSVQTVGIGQSPDRKDIVTHIEYDNFGRQSKAYLPYASLSAGGVKRANALSETNTFYNTVKYQNTLNPYSENFYEDTPLQLVNEIAAPGNDWKEGIADEHTIKKEYKLITTEDHVHSGFSISTDASQNLILLSEGKYKVGNNDNPSGPFALPTIYKFIEKNEHWKAGDQFAEDYQVHIFKDYLGREILKRSFENGTALDTYYVYGDYGNLTFVIPPKVNVADGISSTEINELCYRYKYDTKHRITEKKIPGKGWEYIIYDKLDRPILTQDALQREKSTNEWLFTKYNKFGNQVYTGVLKDNRSRQSIQTEVDNHTVFYEERGTAIFDYTNNAYPNNINVNDILTIKYYDNYSFDKDGLTKVSHNAFGENLTSITTGLLTGSKERVLTSASVKPWITTLFGYDEKGRQIFSVFKNNYLSTIDEVHTKLDFTGKLQKVVNKHTLDKPSQETGQPYRINVEDTFKYDHGGRLLSQKQQIIDANTQSNVREETIVENEYDELGQPVAKKVGTNTLQKVHYKYNVRGWLTNINNTDDLSEDLFAFKLNYNTITKNSQGASKFKIEPLYNGNISETIWKTASDNTQRGYGYTYDALNRLTFARYKAGNYFEDEKQYFGIKKIAYDKNGNILKLTRYAMNDAKTGKETIDNLNYKYFTNSNQLKSVTDRGNIQTGFKDGNTTGDDYVYDVNGNMQVDENKGIQSIEYNHLNLPTKIIFNTDSFIEYTYSATGIKLEKRVMEFINGEAPDEGFVTKYAGNFVYVNDKLSFFNQPEGYVTYSEENINGTDYNRNYQYVYQYKDHLGNIRLSFTDADKDYHNYLESSFEDDFDGWEQNGSVNYSLENGRLKANVNSAFEGVRNRLGSTFSPGEQLKVKIKFDKGNTQSKVRGYFQELDAEGNHLSWNVFNSNLKTGTHEYNYTVRSGNQLILRIDKENTNTGTETQFFVDFVSVTKGSLEIVEENQYYPFGLKHQGYNNVVIPTANNIAQKFKYNGKEYEESLGLNLYEMDVRSYDPTIARWTGIDPVTHHSYSTYSAFDNNPVYWADPSGADSSAWWEGGDNSSSTTIRGLSGIITGNSSPDDIINIDTKSKKATVTKTDDDFDIVSTDGGKAVKTEKGVTEARLNSEGYSVFHPEGVGMGATDFGLTFATGEMIFAKLSVRFAAWWAAKSSKILNTTAKQLQKKFKHAGDFGVTGNFSKANAAKFNSAVNQHINSSGVRAIQGTYRGNPVTHYVNPNTGLNVIANPNGTFLSGWKLNSAQLQNVLQHGGL